MKTAAKVKRHDYLFLPIIKILPRFITPNHISGLRGILVLPLIVLMWLHFYKLSGALYLFAALLDALDGSLARLRNQETKLGAILDPTADKFVNFSVFLGFLFYVDSSVYKGLIIPIIAADTMLFCVAFCKYLIKDICPHLPPDHWFFSWIDIQTIKSIEISRTGANIWGKIKMVSQVIVLSFLLIFDPETSIWVHEKYIFLPDKLTLLHASFPLLIICIFLGLMSLIGHLKVIKFNNKETKNPA